MPRRREGKARGDGRPGNLNSTLAGARPSKPSSQAEHADGEAREPVADPVGNASPQGPVGPAFPAHDTRAVLDVRLQLLPQTARKAAVFDDHVRLAGEHQAERID